MRVLFAVCPVEKKLHIGLMLGMKTEMGDKSGVVSWSMAERNAGTDGAKKGYGMTRGIAICAGKGALSKDSRGIALGSCHVIRVPSTVPN